MYTTLIQYPAVETPFSPKQRRLKRFAHGHRHRPRSTDDRSAPARSPSVSATAFGSSEAVKAADVFVLSFEKTYGGMGIQEANLIHHVNLRKTTATLQFSDRCPKQKVTTTRVSRWDAWKKPKGIEKKNTQLQISFKEKEDFPPSSQLLTDLPILSTRLSGFCCEAAEAAEAGEAGEVGEAA